MARVLLLEHNVDGTIGGSHYALLEICRLLDRARYTPIVVFYEHHSLLEEFKSSGAEVIVTRPAAEPIALRSTFLPEPVRRVVQAAVNAASLVTLRTWSWVRFLRQVRADLVHMNNSFNGDHDLILAAALLRIPCMTHQRGTPGVTGPSELAFVRLLDRILAISTTIEDELHERGVPPSRIRLIHDGIDPARVQVTRNAIDLRRELGIPPDHRVVGIVGNVKRWKGQDVVIRALAQARLTRGDIHGLLVGALAEQQYVDELRQLIAVNRLEGRVHLLGFQRTPADFINLMDVCIHASVEPEPFGLVVLEAMALSKPVIATTVGGPRDIVVDGHTGFLCEPYDHAAIASRMLELLADPELAERMGTAGRRRLETHFTAERNVRSIEEQYHEILQR